MNLFLTIFFSHRNPNKIDLESISSVNVNIYETEILTSDFVSVTTVTSGPKYVEILLDVIANCILNNRGAINEGAGGVSSEKYNAVGTNHKVG